jgi:hypothetical protein
MIGLSAYAAIAGGLFIALWKYPAVALAGVLCMFGLEQWGQASTTYFAQHHTATNYLIGGILVLALLVQGAKKGLSLLAGYPLVGWLTLALFLYAFASAQWAPRSDISLDLWASRWPSVITFIVLSPLLITQTRDLQATNIGILVFGGFLTILLLFFVEWEHRRIVLGHELGNPLAVSTMAAMVVFTAVLADPWPESRWWAAIKWALVALCLALIVRSGSRGQLLGVIAISAVCWPISRRIENLKQFLGWICLLIFLSGITIWSLQRFWAERETYYAGGSRWSDQAMEGAMSGRFDNAIFLVQQCYRSVETIIFGLGNSASFDPRILGIYPHFVPLEILAEEGLIGFALFGLVLYATVRNAFKCLSQLNTAPVDRKMFSALLALFLFTALLSLKQGSLLGNLEPFMFAIILGKHSKIFLERKVVADRPHSPIPAQGEKAWPLLPHTIGSTHNKRSRASSSTFPTGNQSHA